MVVAVHFCVRTVFSTDCVVYAAVFYGGLGGDEILLFGGFL